VLIEKATVWLETKNTTANDLKNLCKKLFMKKQDELYLIPMIISSFIHYLLLLVMPYEISNVKR